MAGDNMSVEREVAITLRGPVALRDLLDALQGHTLPLESLVDTSVSIKAPGANGLPDVPAVRLTVRSPQNG